MIITPPNSVSDSNRAGSQLNIGHVQLTRTETEAMVDLVYKFTIDTSKDVPMASVPVVSPDNHVNYGDELKAIWELSRLMVDTCIESIQNPEEKASRTKERDEARRKAEEVEAKLNENGVAFKVFPTWERDLMIKMAVQIKNSLPV